MSSRCTIPLIVGFEWEQQYDIKMCQVSINTIVTCFDLGACVIPIQQ